MSTEVLVFGCRPSPHPPSQYLTCLYFVSPPSLSLSLSLSLSYLFLLIFFGDGHLVTLRSLVTAVSFIAASRRGKAERITAHFEENPCKEHDNTLTYR